MADFHASEIGGFDFRLPCAICGRKFAVESLEKHQNICEKTSNKKRKAFNSATQRYLTDGITQVPAPAPPPPPPRKTPAIIKKSPQGRKNDGLHLGPLKTHQGISVPSPITRGRLNGGGDYIQCPTCDRNFNDKAADRHIQWCREQNSRIQKSPPSGVAKNRLQARIQYKAPLPGKRRQSPPRTFNSNKFSSPYSQTSLNNLYLPNVGFIQSPGVKVTGKAITAQQRSGEVKKPLARTSSHAGSRNHLIPSDSWEWVTENSSISGRQLKKPSSLNLNNVKRIGNPNRSAHAAEEYDPVAIAQKQLEELMISTQCGSPVVEQISSPIKFENAMNRSNRSSNWSLNSDKEAKEVEEELMDDLIISLEPNNLDDDYLVKLTGLNDARTSRPVRRTVSREEALFGTKNSSGSQDSDYGSLLMRRSPSSPARLSPSHRFAKHNFENNLCTSTSSSEASLPPLGKSESKYSRFCHECGNKYPFMEAKFCCECGVKRFYAT